MYRTAGEEKSDWTEIKEYMLFLISRCKTGSKKDGCELVSEVELRKDERRL